MINQICFMSYDFSMRQLYTVVSLTLHRLRLTKKNVLNADGTKYGNFKIVLLKIQYIYFSGIT